MGRGTMAQLALIMAALAAAAGHCARAAPAAPPTIKIAGKAAQTQTLLFEPTDGACDANGPGSVTDPKNACGWRFQRSAAGFGTRESLNVLHGDELQMRVTNGDVHVASNLTVPGRIEGPTIDALRAENANLRADNTELRGLLTALTQRVAALEAVPAPPALQTGAESLANTKRACPSDMARMGSICIEKTARAAATFVTAQGICHGLGRDLCNDDALETCDNIQFGASACHGLTDSATKIWMTTLGRAFSAGGDWTGNVAVFNGGGSSNVHGGGSRTGPSYVYLCCKNFW